MSHSASVNCAILIILDDVRVEYLFGWMKEGKFPNMSPLIPV
jgi:hypothetical protein